MSDARDFHHDFLDKTVKQKEFKEKSQDILQHFLKNYEPSYMIWNSFYPEAYRSLGLYLGNQWSDAERKSLKQLRRSAFTYNKIYRTINSIVGLQIKSRLGFRVDAVNESASQTADLFTDCIRHVCNQNGIYEKISDAIRYAAVSGISFVRVSSNHDSDHISGDVAVDIGHWNSLLIDPWFCKKDLSDASFVAQRTFLPREKVIALNPSQEDLIRSLPGGKGDMTKFPYLPYARSGFPSDNMLSYTEYYRLASKEKTYLVSQKTGESIPWEGDREHIKFMMTADPSIKLIKKATPVIEFGVICQDTVLYYGENRFGINKYPYIAFTGLFEPSYDIFKYRIQSLVSLVADSQIDYNRKRSALSNYLSSQMTSGWKVKEGAVRDPESLFTTGQGGVVTLNRNSDMNDVQQVFAPEIPSSLFNLESLLANDLQEQLGITPEILGENPDNVNEMSGVLFKMRQASGMTALQPFFDSCRESQKLLGNLLLSTIQANYSPEKIQRITQKPVPQEFYSKIYSKYNVVVEEGEIEDSNQALSQLLALKQMNIPVPDDMIVESSPVYKKKELLEAVRKAGEMQNTMQQMAIAKEQQALDSAAAALKNEALKNLAYSRKSLAETDRANMDAYDKLTTVLERLANIDFATLERALPLLSRFVESQESKAEEILAQAEQDIANERQPIPTEVYGLKPQQQEISQGLENALQMPNEQMPVQENQPQ